MPAKALIPIPSRNQNNSVLYLLGRHCCAVGPARFLIAPRQAAVDYAQTLRAQKRAVCMYGPSPESSSAQPGEQPSSASDISTYSGASSSAGAGSPILLGGQYDLDTSRAVSREAKRDLCR